MTLGSRWVAGGGSGSGVPAAHGASHEIAAADALTSFAQALTPTAPKTANYTAAPGEFVPVDTTAGPVTVTLPTAPPDKTRIGIKHVIQGGTNVATYACAGSDVLNKVGGATSGTLTLLAQASLLQYKASTGIWYVQADDIPLSQLDLRFDLRPIVAEAHIDVPAVNTVTETDIVNLTLPGGSVAAGDLVTLRWHGSILNNSGSSVTYTWRLKIGGTTVLQNTAATVTTGATRRAVMGEARITVESVTAQRIAAQLMSATGGAAGTWAAMLGTTIAYVGRNVAAENLAGDTAIKLTVQMGTADAAAEFVVHASSLEVIRKR